MSPTVPDNQRCGHCKKQASQSFGCNICCGAPGYQEKGPVQTTYCSAACQNIDRKYHDATLCKWRQTRMMLYRAGAMLQQVFYLYQKSKWIWKICKVERVKEKTYQYHDYPPEKCDSLYLYKSQSPALTDALPPFPDDLFLSDREKESALAHLSCHDSILAMHGIVESTLQGICTKIEEIAVNPKNSRFKLILVKSDGTKDWNFYRHEFFRITTRDGEVYALDLTSAQNGHYEPIVPWHVYEKQRVVKIKQVHSLGGTQRAELLTNPPNLYDDFLSRSRGCLNSTVQDWQSGNTAFHLLLTLPEHEFVRKSGELYAEVGAELESLVPAIYQRLWAFLFK